MGRERVLFLGQPDSPVLAHLRQFDSVDVRAIGAAEPLTSELVEEWEPRWAVSHGYRRILRRDVLDLVPDGFINLHISLLPYNRGADPVLWSVLEDTPAGVTIHHIDEGVDTGDVIAQRPVALLEGDTFATMHARCTAEINDLFREVWPSIEAGSADRRPQPPGGTSHRVRDRARVEHLLTQGWDTPCAPLRGRYRVARGTGDG